MWLITSVFLVGYETLEMTSVNGAADQILTQNHWLCDGNVSLIGEYRVWGSNENATWMRTK